MQMILFINLRLTYMHILKLFGVQNVDISSLGPRQ